MFWFVTCLSYRTYLNFRMGHQEGAMRKTMLAVASHATQVNAGETLSEPHAISALAALAQPTRLAIFRLLVKREPIGITAGVIAETVGAPHNSLSSHLAILVRAGLLRSSREGRTIIYRSDVEGMRSLISFLIHDCCNGHPELCGLLGIDPRAASGYAPTTKKAAASKKQVARTRRLVGAR
jgi:ArsR family transcriptional regulator, arsenate/arsenite/antimonite-responsive transcriptional repressor